MIVVVSLVVSLLTLLSMMKIWLGAFWGDGDRAAPRASSTGSAGSAARR